MNRRLLLAIGLLSVAANDAFASQRVLGIVTTATGCAVAGVGLMGLGLTEISGKDPNAWGSCYNEENPDSCASAHYHRQLRRFQLVTTVGSALAGIGVLMITFSTDEKLSSTKEFDTFSLSVLPENAAPVLMVSHWL